ncbi:hypothetical protein K435DRAFT_792836 [Dendrothele bispora CBS 962.96]|uniref:Phosphatidylglycerol/phosphatidylinositol transfer protein n=1 Tax=Dendrothele bispora (strain CBS 962.96) TaxID=1314807 RepID=A0A4S8MH75_DENBC|nr:hypothetical protein K435DRAFT_792836 [Dendrothele bispora CBS 962.96]
MKFIAPLAFVAAMAASVLGQSVQFGAPENGATVSARTNITVEIDVPTPATPFQDVSVAIGLTMCEQFTCGDPKDFMQFLLFAGPLSPERDPQNPIKPAHQNYTVTLPDQTGPAQLGVVHFTLGRAATGFFSDLNSNSINLTLVE